MIMLDWIIIFAIEAFVWYLLQEDSWWVYMIMATIFFMWLWF